MHGVGAAAPGGLDDQLGPQVGVGCAVAGQPHRSVRLGDEGLVGIGIGEHRNGEDAQVSARAEHPTGDLAAVGDQH